MRRVKYIRIVLSVVLLALSTVLVLDVGEALPDWLRHIEKLQFMPALISFGIGMDAFWLFSSLLFGRIYCSSICPLGTGMDFFGYLGRKLYKKKYRYSPPMNAMRYVVFGITALCLVAGFLALPLLIDPYSAYSRVVISAIYPADVLAVQDGLYDSSLILPGVFGIALSALTAVAVSALSFSHGRAYCSSICPVGTVLGVCSRNSVWHFEIDTDKCVDCGLCEQACKASCINLSDHTVDMSRCVVCFNCIKECGDYAITYTSERKRPATPLMQRIKEKTVGERDATPVVTMSRIDKREKQKNNQGKRKFL